MTEKESFKNLSQRPTDLVIELKILKTTCHEAKGCVNPKVGSTWLPWGSGRTWHQKWPVTVFIFRQKRNYCDIVIYKKDIHLATVTPRALECLLADVYRANPFPPKWVPLHCTQSPPPAPSPVLCFPFFLYHFLPTTNYTVYFSILFLVNLPSLKYEHKHLY